MAETAVTLVIEQLAAEVKAEVNFLKGVRDEVERIKAELEIIHPYLRNADQRAEEEGANGDVAAWVRQVRQVSYRIEDVIDQYTLHLAQRTPRHGCVGCLHKLAHLITKLEPRHAIASQIEGIKRTIQDIQSRRLNYGLQSIDEGASRIGSKRPAWNDPRVASLFIEEAELVGIESPRDELMGWMAEEASPKRRVITVLGGGGLGKTTLVKKVYDNQITTGKFCCHAWIAVSQSYKTEELLRNLLRHLHDASKDQSCTKTEKQPSSLAGIEAMNLTALIDRLAKYLEQKRYVVVFDDVWDSKLWPIVKLALPDKKNGSRVIITTRRDDVAKSCKESPDDHIKELQPLPAPRDFELFCKKAFRSENDGRCPAELLESAENIVKKCCGVPLAIVTVGGVLSSKDKVAYKWNKFHDSLSQELKSNPHLQDVERILLLSYFDLPWHLKPCFLYFGIFPEDYSVSCVRLVRIWMAEGFVKEEESRALEETAQEYLTELINRSLVQTSRLDLEGKVRSCRVHDLMREMILSKSKELNFCQILAGEDCSFDSQSRRLSINKKDDGGLNNIDGPSGVRSLFLFRTNDLPTSSVCSFTAKFKLLKVMDFEGAPLNLLPEEVGNLLHLRYLSVRKTKVKKLPRSIGRLRCLLTLDLKMSEVSELPIEVNRLQRLRHLLAYNSRDGNQTGVKIEEGFGCMKTLQKLYFLEADRGDYVIEELKRLRQLRKLGIKKLRRADGKGLCVALENMRHLESLDVKSVHEDENQEIIDLQNISSPPPSLQRLYLKGRLEGFPQWISKLRNLIRLRLCWSGLTEDPLKWLQALPDLLEFGLYEGAYGGESLCFEAGGFRKLKVLELWDLKALNSVTVEEGALPRLEDVNIWNCPRLKDVPDKLAQLFPIWQRVESLLGAVVQLFMEQ